MFIFTGDTVGNVYLINGRDGKVLYTQHVGNNFESSPIVIGNQVVVGSRGHSIYKMSIQ
jgi:outer membrane protein assembly factor BamB